MKTRGLTALTTALVLSVSAGAAWGVGPFLNHIVPPGWSEMPGYAPGAGKGLQRDVEVLRVESTTAGRHRQTGAGIPGSFPGGRTGGGPPSYAGQGRGK